MRKEEILRIIDEMPIEELQAKIIKALEESGVTIAEDGNGIPLSEWLGLHTDELL